MFTAAYKTEPQLRDRGEMDPGRLINHQVIGTLLDSEEFTDLRRQTAGDPYAAAMAVLAQAGALRKLLEQTRQAQEAAKAAAEARAAQAGAAAAVAEAISRAGREARAHTRHERAAQEGRTVKLELEVPSAMAEIERRAIEATLDYTAGDKTRAARALGIGRKTLYRKLQSYHDDGPTS